MQEIIQKTFETKRKKSLYEPKRHIKNFGANNPKQFWEIIKQLKNDHNDNANPIDIEHGMNIFIICINQATVLQTEIINLTLMTITTRLLQLVRF